MSEPERTSLIKNNFARQKTAIRNVWRGIDGPLVERLIANYEGAPLPPFSV